MNIADDNKNQNYYNIAINGRFFNQPLTGVQRFAFEILNALDEVLDETPLIRNKLSLTCYVPRHYEKAAKWNHITLKPIGLGGGNIWEQLMLPAASFNQILLSMCNISPIIHRKNVVVIHDVAVYAYPKAFSLLFRQKYKFVYWWQALFSKKIISVSEFSELQLRKFLPIKSKKIEIINNSGNHINKVIQDNNYLVDKGLIKNNFFILVGNQGQLKNNDVVYRAMEKLRFPDLKLVVVGGTYIKIFGKNEREFSKSVHVLDYVSDRELKALYQNAIALVFPSFYEGFGIPALEAMNNNCPVICSNIPTFHEIYEEAALYFNPNDANDCVRQMELMAEEKSIRARYSKLGKIQAKKYDWKESAKKLLTILLDEAM